MSKRHQASRRRSYGRRQHELHERAELSSADGVARGQAEDELELIVVRSAPEELTGRFSFGYAD